MPVATPDLDCEPFAASRQHLDAHLGRVDRLVRAQTIRWRRAVASTRPAKTWGMLLVSDDEVDRFLAAPFAAPGHLDAEVENLVEAYWREADELADALTAVAGRSSDDELRLERLVELFGLGELERDVLLVVLLGELDERYRRLYGYLMDNVRRTRPTVELLAQTLLPVARRHGDPTAAVHGVFDPGSALLAAPLVDLADADDPLGQRGVRLEVRVGAYLLGSDRPDARLAPYLLPETPASAAESLESPELGVRHRGLSAVLAEPGDGAVVFFHGRYGSGRRNAARRLAPTLVFDVSHAARRNDFGLLVRLASREARLTGKALGVLGFETLLDDDHAEKLGTLLDAVEARPGLTFFLSERTWDPLERFRGRRFLRLDLAPPDHNLRRRMWEAELSRADGVADRGALASALAASFQLTAGQIADAVAAARSRALERGPGPPRLTADDLHDGCRRQTSRRLATLAQRIEPRAGIEFDDLVLPPLQTRQIGELRHRIRHRHRVMSELGFERRLSLGRGLVALFTGSSGTGKTMAAELLAKEQGVDLYRIDLASVVSKWVGETEKNLGRLFDEAEDANALLLFDEADALFGQRGEVQDARDRWANLEVNYLLQRVEAYTGVVVLTTNLRQNIDHAFLRRVQTIVEFPPADAEARFRIWRGMFPEGLARPGDGELRRLAERFRLSGGEIKNIVVDAAFRAVAEAREGPAEIGLRHLVLAVARGYQKEGKIVSRGEFGDGYLRLLAGEPL